MQVDVLLSPQLSDQLTEGSLSLTETVTKCFERVLQRHPIGLDDNFFELGGDSLLALSLLIEIKQETGRELEVATIYDGATVRTMTDILQSETPPEFSLTVLLKPGSAVAPIFFVHGLFGNAIELVELGKRIASPRPVYVLQARGLDGHDRPNDRVEAMADDYVEAISKLQSKGPYLLVGYSFGGLVAIEMARRLRARGDEVAYLACIDTYPAKRLWPEAARFGIWIRKIQNRARLLGKIRHREEMYLLWRKMSSRSGRGLHAAASMESVGEIILPESLRRVREAGYQAFQNYEPAIYSEPVIFFRAGVPMHYPANPQKTWERYLTNLTIHTLPGDHFSMLSAYLENSLRLLSESLESIAPPPAIPACGPEQIAEKCVA